MSLLAVCSSYKTASIEQRERIAVSADQLANALSTLVANEGVNEALIISTCNRVEIYVEAKTDRIGSDAVLAFLTDRAGAQPEPGSYFIERGMEAVRHLFRVVCSLDSQVLGEAQILGQVKRAYEAANEAGTAGDTLTRLFKDAIHLGKRVRTETAIGSDSVSLSTTAFKVVADVYHDLPSRRVLIVGAGEMAALTRTYLQEAGCRDIMVTTRTFEHAQAFAAECGGTPIRFEDRYDALAYADAAFCATAAEEAVIEASALRRAREDAGTQGEPLVIVDEAVPRDVEQECADLLGVTLYNQETLAAIIDEGLERRYAAVGSVERMVAEAEEEFLIWMQQRQVTPTIKEIYAKGEACVESELARAIKALANARGEELTPEEKAILEAFGSSVMKKLLHGPTVRLRKEAQTADSYYYTSSARYLFGLDTYPLGTHHDHCGKPCAQGGACPHDVDPSMRDLCRARELKA